MLPLISGALLTSLLHKGCWEVHMCKDLLAGSVADDIHQLYFLFWENILTRVEEHLGQHCQTSNTFSNSSWRCEEGEEHLHTAHMAAVSLARSKPTLDHSTALRCWVCDHLITKTQMLELGEACCLALLPSPPPSLQALQCYSPQYLRLADLF